jgi:hypothetical protein
MCNGLGSRIVTIPGRTVRVSFLHSMKSAGRAARKTLVNEKPIMHTQLMETSNCYRFIREMAFLQGLLTLIIIAASSAAAAMSDSPGDLILSGAVAVLREMTSWLRIDASSGLAGTCAIHSTSQF